MTDSLKIRLPTLDAAYDQAMSEALTGDKSSLEALGHNHGVRLLRQRFGGQFLKNQSHFITPDQQTACSVALQEEIALRKTLSPETISPDFRQEAAYWQGVAQGAAAYERRLIEAMAPGLPEAMPRRKHQL